MALPSPWTRSQPPPAGGGQLLPAPLSSGIPSHSTPVEGCSRNTRSQLLIDVSTCSGLGGAGVGEQSAAQPSRSLCSPAEGGLLPPALCRPRRGKRRPLHPIAAADPPGELVQLSPSLPPGLIAMAPANSSRNFSAPETRNGSGEQGLRGVVARRAWWRHVRLPMALVLLSGAEHGAVRTP